MFIWTSIAHMALPLGQAGINEIPNESAVLSAMQSGIWTRPAFIFFPVSALAKTQLAGEERSDETMQQRIAANPSGILMYHAPGRPFAFGKSPLSSSPPKCSRQFWYLALANALWQLYWASRFRSDCRNSGRDNNQRFYWNWYGFPGVYTASYMASSYRFRSRWSCCRAATTKAKPAG